MSNIEDTVRDLIKAIDNNPDREGLVETPKRVAKFIKEFYGKEPFNVTTFENEGYDEMITQINIPFYSMCEHHILPFFGVAHIAYIPDKKIVGLSKLSRVLDHFAHNLQNQERITTQVVEYLYEKLDPQGVAVVLAARHMCMEMRGIRKIGAETTTSALKGAFKHNEPTRVEFFQMINK
ncbi:MAG: GTP cyclohydrolase I FolE [Candidatus Microsaccharimonas sp.]